MQSRLEEQYLRGRLGPRPLHEAKPGAFAGFASLALRRYNDTAKFRELEARRLRDWLAARGL